MNEGSSRNGASLSMKRLTAEGSLLGTLGYERKALRTGISIHGGSFGQPGVGLSTGDFERWLKGAQGGAFLCMELCERNLEGGLPCWGPWTIGRKGSGDGISFHRDPTGEPGRGLICQGH